ncbi:MAG: radical SAM protein [Anaerolineae bacterium]
MGGRVLRPGLNPDTDEESQKGTRGWRVSTGSAAVLGLQSLRMDVLPTTAYLMLGQRCSRNCAFCTQARDSHAHADALSRVMWPEFEAPKVAEALAAAFREGRIARACFQVTVSPGYLDEVRQAVQTLAQNSAVPTCVSVTPRHIDDVRDLLEAGADKVTIALDAASQRVYREAKSGSWQVTRGLLEACAQAFPGHMATHLIVGLGETEREMADCIQTLTDWGVSVGLFAFTPVSGTAMAERPAPPLLQYRRMQAARWLIVHGLARGNDFAYDAADHLVGYGLPPEALTAALADGEAFRTSGCPGCNRPYYNERPGGVLYNYARPLTSAEACAEMSALLQSLSMTSPG